MTGWRFLKEDESYRLVIVVTSSPAHPGPGTSGQERLHQEGAQQEAHADEEVLGVDEGPAPLWAQGEDEEDTFRGDEDAVTKELGGNRMSALPPAGYLNEPTGEKQRKIVHEWHQEGGEARQEED